MTLSEAQCLHTANMALLIGNGLGDTLKNATRLSVGATWAL